MLEPITSEEADRRHAEYVSRLPCCAYCGDKLADSKAYCCLNCVTVHAQTLLGNYKGDSNV
jgi:hypothetical protein